LKQDKVVLEVHSMTIDLQWFLLSVAAAVADYANAC